MRFDVNNKAKQIPTSEVQQMQLLFKMKEEEGWITLWHVLCVNMNSLLTISFLDIAGPKQNVFLSW